MADGIGLSVGAAKLTAVHVGRAAVTRTAVLTRYPNRPAEVGVPGENPNLAERGLIITDFVDRVGDPVAIIAADGSSHRAEVVLADALRALLVALAGNGPSREPVGVAYPAHWRAAAIDALRGALAELPEFRSPTAALLVSDVTAALTALQHDPGVPTRGVIALCDFGGTGTSITLADAGRGFQPVGPTVRYDELSGDLIDQALLTRIVGEMSAAGAVDLSSTSAIGSLTRLRAQCRSAKERLSTAAVTSLKADLPGADGELRVTRAELDEAISQPLSGFVDALQDAVRQSGIRPSELVAVATVGGGARMAIITTTLSEHLRVPVITAAQPELAAAIGSGLKAVRGTVEEGATSLAPVPAAAAAAAALAPDPAQAPMSSTFRALAWSDADDVPEVAPSDDYAYDDFSDAGVEGSSDDGGSARPPMEFEPAEYEEEAETAQAWYRRPPVIVGAAMLVVLAAVGWALVVVLRNDSSTEPTGNTMSVTATPLTPSTSPSVPTELPPPAQEVPPTQTITEDVPSPAVTVTEQAPAQPPAAPPPAEPPPAAPSSEAPPPPASEPPPASQPPPVSNPPSTTMFTIPGPIPIPIPIQVPGSG
ncbi:MULTISPECIES: Hsp70 family protein [unclassified Mycobacterium]|uniref:Hsp70 family protein n=1 Tax=unclassified Mycobacterium TaxID=2642494 RepID=UPI0029C7AF3E|nr:MULTISPECIES: Hsp70 family protein [unclassified Mycobacterium]